MGFKKTPEAIVRMHADLVKGYACEPRKMFGFQVFFVNNNMWTGVYEDGIMMRLSKEHKKEIMGENDEAVPFRALGREMKDYVFIAEPLLGDVEFMARWIEISYGDVFGLPPKPGKKRGK